MGEAAFTWGIRACLRQGGLSRNKVSVGEPADGSPPLKPRKTGGSDAERRPAPHLFFVQNNIEDVDEISLSLEK